jgi:hypothetical protein
MKRNSKLLAIPTVARCAVALTVALFAIGFTESASAVPQEAAAGASEKVLAGFRKRVDGYVELKKKLEKDLPKPKTGDRETGKVEKTEDTLAARIMAARKDAGRGDIFGDAAPYFKRIIQHDSETRGGRDAYAAMEEVPGQSPPTVNALYPEKAALATVPPLILVNLPQLPDGLEYRFMGRDLILRDRDANVIIDFVTGAVPVIRK